MRYTLCLILFLLGGCAAPRLSSDERVVDSIYTQAPIILNAEQIQVDSQNSARLSAPYIETRLKVPPEASLNTWIEKRFQPLTTGRMTLAHFIIEEASLTETREETAGFFFMERVKYLLTMKLKLIFEQDGRQVYCQTVGGWESRTIGARSSLAEKEEVWHEMSETLIAKLDAKLLDLLRADSQSALIAVP